MVGLRELKVVAICLAVVLTAAATQGCEYVSATQVNHEPPEEIPVWIVKVYGVRNLCGCFTPYGYFKDFLEYDAFLRWKYPDIYDSRAVNLFLVCQKTEYGKKCKLNKSFAEKYWSDTEKTRKMLRRMWKYPGDWRELIPVSKMLYFEGGETMDALDKRVAITPELIKKAKSKYGQIKVSKVEGENTVRVQKEIPDYYKNVLEDYEKLRKLMAETLSSPITWSFAGLMALIVLLAGSNAALAVALSRMQKTQTAEFKFFRRIN